MCYDLSAILTEDLYEWFPEIAIKLGVKQVCPLSPLLLALYFDQVHQYIDSELKKVNKGWPQGLVEILSSKNFIKLFASDVVVLAHSLPTLRRLFSIFSSYCDDRRLVINQDKNKLMTADVSKLKNEPKQAVSFGSFVLSGLMISGTWVYRCTGSVW